MDDHVGTLAVRVRTDLVGREHELRDAAEQATRTVIERVSALLEARAPGRVVVLRALPVRLRLGERDGASDLREAVEREAERIALEVEAGLPREELAPPPDAPMAAFADEAMFVASALLARARGQPAWFHARALRAEPFERMAADRAFAVAVLVRLAGDDRLVEVAAEMPAPLAARLAEVIAGGHQGGASRAEDASIVLELAERAARWPALHRDVRRLALLGFAHAAAARLGERAGAIEASRVASWADRALALSTPGAPARALQDDAAGPGAADPTTPPAPRALDEDRLTDHAGLFYLLPPILELGLAEALWQACLPEGAVVARALGALVPGDDPALDVIAGEPIEIPPIEDAQVAEVTAAVLAALVVALPRGGRAELPAGHVRLVEHAAGRLLVVTARDAPFVLFARPIADPADAQAALAALTSWWPAHAPLHGDPALIELDRTGRLLHGAEPAVAPFLVAGDTAAAAALGSVLAGAPCQLVIARVGDEVTDVRAWVAHRLARPGRIVVAPELIEVRQPADAVDLDLRRAGIDRDPGWVPWLASTVRLHFED